MVDNEDLDDMVHILVEKLLNALTPDQLTTAEFNRLKTGITATMKVPFRDAFNTYHYDESSDTDDIPSIDSLISAFLLILGIGGDLLPEITSELKMLIQDDFLDFSNEHPLYS